MAAAQQQVVVGGENIEVVAVEAADLFARIDNDSIRQWLQAVGFVDGQYLEETIQSLNENGFDLPNAWVCPVRADLMELNVGAGYVSGVIEKFQRELVLQLGVIFVRKMQGSVRTDSDVAGSILKAKHEPQLQQVSVETGYAPLPESWTNSMREIQGWVRPYDEQLAVAVGQIEVDYSIRDADLVVPIGNVRSIALGTVLRGRCGFGEMYRVLSEAVRDRGDGLEMLRSIQATVFADLDDALVQRWQYPVPVNQLHLVEAGVMEWNVQRSRCRKLGRFIVDDPAVAKASLEQLLGGSPDSHHILNFHILNLSHFKLKLSTF